MRLAQGILIAVALALVAGSVYMLVGIFQSALRGALSFNEALGIVGYTTLLYVGVSILLVVVKEIRAADDF